MGLTPSEKKRYNESKNGADRLLNPMKQAE